MAEFAGVAFGLSQGLLLPGIRRLLLLVVLGDHVALEMEGDEGNILW
jgi:hypothetical protein